MTSPRFGYGHSRNFAGKDAISEATDEPKLQLQLFVLQLVHSTIQAEREQPKCLRKRRTIQKGMDVTAADAIDAAGKSSCHTEIQTETDPVSGKGGSQAFALATSKEYLETLIITKGQGPSILLSTKPIKGGFEDNLAEGFPLQLLFRVSCAISAVNR